MDALSSEIFTVPVGSASTKDNDVFCKPALCCIHCEDDVAPASCSLRQMLPARLERNKRLPEPSVRRGHGRKELLVMNGNTRLNSTPNKLAVVGSVARRHVKDFLSRIDCCSVRRAAVGNQPKWFLNA